MFLDKIALILAIIGGLTWGRIGILRVSIGGPLFGGLVRLVRRVVSTLVGLAPLWCISPPSPDTRGQE